VRIIPRSYSGKWQYWHLDSGSKRFNMLFIFCDTCADFQVLNSTVKPHCLQGPRIFVLNSESTLYWSDNLKINERKTTFITKKSLHFAELISFIMFTVSSNVRCQMPHSDWPHVSNIT
jgi:hypothetical protein